MASLLGSKSVDGLRLTQSLWSKSENLLRSTSHALGTAEHFLSAAGSLIQERGDDFSELKSFLLQVDQAIGISQLLLMGTLGNFTLSKRSEILEKSSVNESLKDSLLSSPLSDKIFGLSVQEEMKKLPHPVKVNVQVTNGKRSVVTNHPSGSTHTFPKKRKLPLLLPSPIFLTRKNGPRRQGIANRKLPPRLLLTPPKREEPFSVPFPSIPVGGRLTHFLSQWEKITTDYWGGLHLQFLRSPPLSAIPISLSHTSDKEKRILLSEEVQSLILKGAIERVQDPFQSPGFYSRVFLVPKKTGGMKPVIDLSILNTFLLVPHFKMETNRSIRSCIHPGMWTTSLDLMDAYFHIPIAPPFRKFLRFVWDNTVYQFQTLPFGISTAPLVFTRVFQTVIAHLHTLSVQIHSYLDDSLIRDFDQQTLVSQMEMVIQFFLNLGFLISWKKSELTPSQNFLFLGEHYRTNLGLIFPPEEKFVSLCQRILLFQHSQLVTAGQFSQLLGFLNSLAEVVPLGRLHIRPLQFYLLQHWLPASQDWEAKIPLHPSLLPHLQCWINRENVMKGLSLSVPVPTLTIYTDASNMGWGAYLEGSWALGLWSPLQQKEHINLLEMITVHLSLSHFRTTPHLKSLVLATDNTTVVAYLKNQGGTHCFSLYSLCREILLLCSELQIQLVVRHIPGHLNVLADTLSRSLATVNTEWELLQVIFNAISLLWGHPHLDLFATSLNHKLDIFVSPVPDPLAYAVDAMSISWKGMFAYAFPPFRSFKRWLWNLARSFLLHRLG
jgi:hypothetical protein